MSGFPKSWNAPRAGGSPGTMITGVGVVAAGLLGWAYSRKKHIENRDDPYRPSWQERINTLQSPSTGGTKVVNASAGSEPRTYLDPNRIPLPSNDNSSGSDTYRASFLTSVAGNPDNVKPPPAQRLNDNNTTYTKASRIIQLQLDDHMLTLPDAECWL
ncbi:hypothetical protein C8Q75DRAFT_804802 [Abortiporus biennis]|nr:hypothetical protein C8Q75DRAFT_804802 [Abortiporus biennis]